MAVNGRVRLKVAENLLGWSRATVGWTTVREKLRLELDVRGRNELGEERGSWAETNRAWG